MWTHILVDVPGCVEGGDIVNRHRGQDLDAVEDAGEEMDAGASDEDQPQDLEQGVANVHYGVVLHKSAHAVHF